MEGLVPDNIKAQYEQMQDAMTPLLRRHSVAIAAHYNGQFRQHATGTLVQFSDHYFLVTAAHAIEKFDKGKKVYPDLQLFVDNGDSNAPVPLYGKYQATEIVRGVDVQTIRLPDERNDLWDIGIWDLDQQTVNALTTKSFLNRRSISISADLTSGVYFLAGCPCEWFSSDPATREMKWKWFRYLAHPYPEREQLEHFDERFHMVLNLGEDSQLPEKLQGISGCSIWRLSDTPVSEDWSVDQAKVVALETCVDPTGPHKAIRGTKWQYVLPVLTDMYPEIRDGFKLWLPGPE